MRKILIIIVLFFIIAPTAKTQVSLSKKLSGRIMLSVQENGEAWYIYTLDQKRYYLGRPEDAFVILKKLGIGILNSDLNKIPVGILTSDELDSDEDGLPDNIEISLGTNPHKKDSDDDGFLDLEEIKNNFNPNGPGKIEMDNIFTEKNLGKIFLQTEKNGEAWYVDPISKKRYFLSRPKIAFEIMKKFGLGITTKDLEKIDIGVIIQDTENTIPPSNKIDGKQIIIKAGEIIRKKNLEEISQVFMPELENAIKYTINNASDENILLLGNFLSGAKLHSSSPNKLVYKNTAYFNGENHNVFFNVEKQEDGTWLMMNL